MISRKRIATLEVAQQSICTLLLEVIMLLGSARDSHASGGTTEGGAAMAM